MISTKLASIIAVAAFDGGSLFAPPVQQAIAAVIATDVQCTGFVGAADIAGNAVTAAKIKDGEVKAAEIATDAVGAAELQGVTKLLFGQCKTDAEESAVVLGSHTGTSIDCSIAGTDSDDSAIAFLNQGNSCLHATHAYPRSGVVQVDVVNWCAITLPVDQNSVAVLVY